MINLEPGRAEDLHLILCWNDGKGPEFLMQWAGPGFEHPLTEAQLHRHLDGAIDGRTQEHRFYRIVLQSPPAEDQTVGVVELSRIDRENCSARVAHFLLGDPAVRGQGIGTEALNHLLSVCFEELGLHRVSLGVFDFNEGAIRCYEKAGFRKEGLLRDVRRVGERYWSLFEMSILSHEYRAMGR